MKIKADPPRGILKTTSVAVDVLPTPPVERANPISPPLSPYETWLNSRVALEDHRPTPPPKREPELRRGFGEWLRVHVLRKPPRYVE